jgi:hypothetical protein
VTLCADGVWTIEEPISVAGWTIGHQVFEAGSIDGIHDCILQPLRGDLSGDAVQFETNIPEAVRLAWGVDAPVLS